MMVAPPSSFKAWYTRKMFGYGVDEVQLVAGTEKSVTKENGTRESRDTQYGRYFATREEAVAYAVQLAENHIASAKSKIAAAEAFIESIKP